MTRRKSYLKYFYLVLIAAAVFYSGAASACTGLAASVTTDGRCTDYGISYMLLALLELFQIGLANVLDTIGVITELENQKQHVIRDFVMT